MLATSSSDTLRVSTWLFFMWPWAVYYFCHYPERWKSTNQQFSCLLRLRKSKIPFFSTFSFFFFSSSSPLMWSLEPDDPTAVGCGTSSENEAVDTVVPEGTATCFTKNQEYIN